MKTQTRSQIIKIIEKSGKIRPSELRALLQLSAQAIHRHLRSLAEQGVIETKGSPPFTQYVLAGIPDLEAVSNWMNARMITENPHSHVSETRDVLTARLPHLKAFIREGLPEQLLPLVIATAGEIGNNSFDHNLGQWRDIPGCWFESQTTRKLLWICIADRGQGIFRSLAQVYPKLTSDQTAIEMAFEAIISGRAPERRGNGLKFVKRSFLDTPGSGIACLSGVGRIHYGEQGAKCISILEKHLTKVKGTVTLMVWRLK